MWPWTLRPPDLRSGAVRLFSGLSLVISAKSETVIRRRPAEVGLYFLIPMIVPQSVPVLGGAAFEQLDGVTLLEGDDGLLVVRPLAHGLAHALDLAAGDQGPDVGDLDLEGGLDGDADVVLVGSAVHQERVLAELLPG